MSDTEYRDWMRAEARKKYLQDIKWARADYRNTLRFADAATIRPEYAGTSYYAATHRWTDGTWRGHLLPKLA